MFDPKPSSAKPPITQPLTNDASTFLDKADKLLTDKTGLMIIAAFAWVILTYLTGFPFWVIPGICLAIACKLYPDVLSTFCWDNLFIIIGAVIGTTQLGGLGLVFGACAGFLCQREFDRNKYGVVAGGVHMFLQTTTLLLPPSIRPFAQQALCRIFIKSSETAGNQPAQPAPANPQSNAQKGTAFSRAQEKVSAMFTLFNPFNLTGLASQNLRLTAGPIVAALPKKTPPIEQSSSLVKNNVGLPDKILPKSTTDSKDSWLENLNTYLFKDTIFDTKRSIPVSNSNPLSVPATTKPSTFDEVLLTKARSMFPSQSATPSTSTPVNERLVKKIQMKIVANTPENRAKYPSRDGVYQDKWGNDIRIKFSRVQLKKI